MKLKDGGIEHDHPELVKGLKQAIKNIEGSGDIKVAHVAKIIGVPHELVKHYMERMKKDAFDK